MIRNGAVLSLGMIVLMLIIAVNVPHVSFDLAPIEHHNRYELSNATFGPGGALDASFVFMGIMLSLVLIAVAYFLKHKKDLEKRFAVKGIFNDLIAGAIIILLINGVLLLSNRVNMDFSSHSISGAAVFNALLFYLVFLIFLVVVIFAVLSNIHSIKKPERVEKKKYEKYVERAIYKVKMTSDVRGAILKAYREMESMVATHGVRDEMYLTPREFRDFALSTLKLSPEPVETLVSLFEDARYSSHELGEDDRNKALESLEAIRNELSR